MNLDFTKLDGLIPAVIQDDQSGRVLMVGFMNETAFARTLESGNVTFFSRSRNKLLPLCNWKVRHTFLHSMIMFTDADRNSSAASEKSDVPPRW